MQRIEPVDPRELYVACRFASRHLASTIFGPGTNSDFVCWRQYRRLASERAMPELLPAAGGWRNVEYGYNSRGPYVFGVLGTKHMDEMQMRDVVEHTNFGVGSVLLSWEQDPVDSVIVAVREVLERHWTSASLPVAPDVQDSFGMALKAMVDVGGVMGARLQSESGAHLLLMGSDRRLLAMAALRPDEMLDDLPFDEIGYHIPLLG